MITIHTADGQRAVADRVPSEGSVEVRFTDPAGIAQVPVEMLTRRGDGSYSLAMRRADLSSNVAAGESKKIETIPVVDERLRVRTESVESGRVVVHVVPTVKEEVIDVPLTDEHVEVRRVAASRFVERPEPPREVDGVTIIPIYEEVLVVEKRLRVKEELHIHRRQTVRHERQRVSVRQEEAQVTRTSPEAPHAPLPNKP